MLSLLSLLLTSGTVLRADTEEWTPYTYPNPKTNSTLCNTPQNSTLCDPDHILTNYWRAEIDTNIIKQMKRLEDSFILYTEKTSLACFDNNTDPIKIYVLLAKRIQTVSNQTITESDLIVFGNELAQRYGLDQQPCKNFILLIGIEIAKLAYVRTGKDLKLPSNLMQQIFKENDLFTAKNYMEGLNEIVTKIGDQMLNPFKGLEELIKKSTATTSSEFVEIEKILQQKNKSESANVTTDKIINSSHIEYNISRSNEFLLNKVVNSTWLIIIFMGFSIIIAILFLIFLCLSQIKEQKNFNQGMTEKNKVLKNEINLSNQTKDEKNIIVKKMYYSFQSKLSTNSIVDKPKNQTVKNIDTAKKIKNIEKNSKNTNRKTLNKIEKT